MARKRANGEGTLRLRNDGRWELAVMDGFQTNGKPRMKHFYGRSQSEVRKKAEVWNKDKKDGIDVTANYTFKQWSDIWFEHHKDDITSTTQESYKYTLRILQSHFGTKPIKEIKAFDIEVFLKEMKKEGKSRSYLSSLRGMLYQIFHKAAANDFIRKNPVEYADKIKYRDPPKKKDSFTAEEVKLLMEKLPVDRIGMSIRLMLGTGMRSQELLALEPKHIENDGSIIHIQQAINMVKGTAVVGQPKSKDSYRDVPVPPNLRPYALALRNTELTYIWEAGKKDQPCNPSHFRDQFKKAISSIEGVRVLTPHSCRHTYVSQMQALGVDLMTIQSMVGHADLDMTKHYLKVQDSVKQSAIEKFSEAFPVEE